MSVSLEDIDAEIARRKALRGVTVEDIDAEIARRKAKSTEVTGRGVMEAVATIGTSALAEPIAGLAGGVAAMNPFGEEGDGARVVQQVKDYAYKPGSQGQSTLRAGVESVKSLGGLVPDAIKEPIKQGFTALKESPDAVAREYGPLAGSVAAAVPAAITNALPAGVGIRAARAGAKQAGKQALHARMQAPSIATADRMKRAVAQGFDQNAINSIAIASPLDRRKMRQMINIAKRIDEDGLYGVTARSSSVIGDSLMNRYLVVRRANEGFAKQFDTVTNALKGKDVDFAPAVSQFADELSKDLGVTFNQVVTKGGSTKIVPNFNQSIVKGSPPARKLLRDLLEEMSFGKPGAVPDAHALHRLKLFIDESVSYGKVRGLAGRTQRVVKNLRHNIDAALDKKFPEYDRVNSGYAETIEALDNIQQIAGKLTDLSGPTAGRAMGIKFRRIMSNAESGDRLINVADDIERVARKYAGSGRDLVPAGTRTRGTPALNDDLKMQSLFSAQLHKVFGVQTSTAAQNVVEEGGKQAAQALASPKTALLNKGLDAAATKYNKVRGRTRENAYKAIEELLGNQ